MESTVVATFRSLLARELTQRGADLGLDPALVSVEYVLNWGGFVNHSFRASDGLIVRHLKLAAEPEARQALWRWRAVHDLLEHRYHAPRMVGWVTLPETEVAGPVFQWIDGSTPDPIPRELLARILPMVRRLHHDGELRERVGAPDDGATGTASCADVYRRTFGLRLAEDLRTVAEQQPPFVTAERLAWMRDESEQLSRAVAGAAAFQEPADSPTHGDLWSNNLLLTPAGEWFVLDWDDLALGDPALDLAMLLGPSPRRVRQADARDAGDLAPPLRERLELYARATLLDWAVDSLADYIDADASPEHRDRVRAEKERVHREAVRAYEERYG
ncbi:MAG TPA: phosphotransferase [Gemmatimonadaceae bacterium]|nr:phosphotransferase [Gemmatimonadaceae bacterium]